jgi:formylmethanofuran dehydrogenase subunit E
MTMRRDRVAELKEQIADLKKQWPAHSVPPAMMERLDALEEELMMELEKRGEANEGQEPGVFSFLAIGYVENDFQEPAKPDILRASPSRIVLTPDLVEGLTGLEPGMALQAVFVFHRSKGCDLLQHPRGDRSRQKRGVFALRSPNRPNSIGVTEVELLAIEGNTLTVRGLDAIKGTPVLDLKPVYK